MKAGSMTAEARSARRAAVASHGGRLLGFRKKMKGMKTRTGGIPVLAIMVLLGTARAGNDGKEHPLRLNIDLVDGSRLVGVPSAESVPVRTPYAKMDIELKLIRTVKIAGDHESAAIDMRNGDQLKGVIRLEPIKLETIFGSVSVATEHIREFRVVLDGVMLPEALKKGLVLYYSFDRDDGKQVADSRDSGIGGTVIEGAQWVGEGRFGGAYRVSGGRGRIEAGDSSVVTLKPDDDRTFCLWWKKDGNIQHKVLLSKWSQDNSRFGFTLFTLPSEGRYYMPFQTGHWAKFAAVLSDDKWNHVAVVKMGTSYRVYHNGQDAPLVESMGWPMTVDMTVNKPLEIGGTHVTDFGFEGLVDEVMVFDRALSSDAINQIHDAQK